jgi:hypothetical protein
MGRVVCKLWETATEGGWEKEGVYAFEAQGDHSPWLSYGDRGAYNVTESQKKTMWQGSKKMMWRESKCKVPMSTRRDAIDVKRKV